MKVVFGPETFGQRHGGISRYFIELHRRLPGLGVSSTIVAGAHHNAYLSEVRRVRGVRLPDRVERERLRASRDQLNDGLVRGYLRAQRTPPIYHQTYYQGTVAQHYRGPVVVTAYDLIHAKFSEHFPADDRTVEQQRRAFARANLILAISHTTKSDLVETFGIAESKVKVTHLGVTPPPAVALVATGAARPYLLYVGLRSGYKNWARFARAVAASGLAADLDVVSIGGGPFTDRETQLVEELGLSASMRQCAADDALLDAYYREAVAFVYPSVYEGFGLPPLEAMARGCPVLASRAGSIPEVLGDAAVLMDPHDVDAMAAALLEVVEPARRERLAAAGQVLVEQYTWDRTAERTVEAYQTLR